VGRLSTALPPAVRLLMLKADGAFMVWSDGGGAAVKPLNWMAPPTVLEEQRDEDGGLCGLTVRRRGQEERLEIRLHEVISDVEHELDANAGLEK
jgi:endonuclease